MYSLTFWPKFAHFSHFSLSTQNHSNQFLAKIRQNTKCIALLFGQNSPILATFHSPLKITQIDFSPKSPKYQVYSLTFWPKFAHFSHFSLSTQNHSNRIFRQNSPKYQVYSLTFWPKFAHFSHFSLSTQNHSNRFFAKIRQNTKCIALLFGQNSPILATFHSPLKITQINFSPKFAKIPSV